MKNRLQEVLQAYGWQHLTPSPVQPDVWQVGDHCLKRLACPAQRGDFIVCGMEQARNNGFTAGQLPIRLPDHSSCYQDERGNVWLACQWLAGDRCYFQHPRHLGQAAGVLAQFHQAAQGFTCPGGRVGYHNHPQRLAKQQQDLLAYRQMAQAEDSPFSRRYLALLPTMYQRGQQAIELLDQSEYPALADRELQAGRFIHGDVAGRNFIQGPDRQVMLIDYGSLRYDIAMWDVAHLLSRGLADACWQQEAADTILEGYLGARQVDGAELQVAAALALYPQTFWRLGQRYYQRSCWDRERLLWKLDIMGRYYRDEQVAVNRAVQLCCQGAKA